MTHQPVPPPLPPQSGLPQSAPKGRFTKKRVIVSSAIVIGVLVVVAALGSPDGQRGLEDGLAAGLATPGAETPEPTPEATPAPVATPEPSATDTPWTQGDIEALTSTFAVAGDCDGLRSMFADASAKAPTLDMSVLASAVAACDATPEATPAPAATRALTAAQENAIQSAQDYLDYTAFSRKSLIDQLKYEGCTKAVATFAVDSIAVDWKEQAYLSGRKLPRLHVVLAEGPHRPIGVRGLHREAGQVRRHQGVQRLGPSPHAIRPQRGRVQDSTRR